jgi:hypothetical protein
MDDIEHSEYSERDFEEWKADHNVLGDLDRDYYAYVEEYIEDEGSAEDMLTFKQFAYAKYEEFLREVHKDDELDDKDEPFPGSEKDED